LKKFLGMFGGADFVNIDIDCVTLPATEEFDFFA